MSRQQETSTICKTQDPARNTANALFGNSFADIARISPAGREIGAAEAILIAGHAIIAKLDAMQATHLEAMREAQESCDLLATSIDALAVSVDDLKRAAKGKA